MARVRQSMALSNELPTTAYGSVHGTRREKLGLQGAGAGRRALKDDLDKVHMYSCNTFTRDIPQTAMIWVLARSYGRRCIMCRMTLSLTASAHQVKSKIVVFIMCI